MCDKCSEIVFGRTCPVYRNGDQTGDLWVELTFPRTVFADDGGVGRYNYHFDAIHAHFEVFMVRIVSLLPEFLGTL